MNILFIVSEMEGLVKTGGLADVARNLPQALNRAGHDTRVILPFYRDIKTGPAKVEKSFTFSIRVHIEYQVKVHQMTYSGITLYCVDIPELFDRPGLYSDSYHAYDDNGERFCVFSLAVLDFMQHFGTQIGFHPDIMHCNDWHTAPLPALFKADSHWQQQNCKTLLTIHNGAFQGIFSKYSVPTLLHRLGEFHYEYEDDVINFLKLGIIDADAMVPVSPNYAAELQTELGSHHLYEIFLHHANKITGILNGCDYQDWSPATDPYIDFNYDANCLSEKIKNKQAIQKAAGMEMDPKIPVISQVCRLTDQKGLNFLLPAIKELVNHRVQIFIAGTGDPLYVDQLEYLAKKYSDVLHFHHGFSEQLAHKYMAGSDFFLVPSLFEPCGLTQMYALAYGTLPIVREVGGLKDTVTDLTQSNATGIIFKEPDAAHLVSAIRRGLLFYHESAAKFTEVQQRAMTTKFLWQDSAQQYIDVYEKISVKY